MLREFVSSNGFNLIVSVSDGYVTGDRGLAIFTKDFDILDRFKSIKSDSSGDVNGGNRDLFCSSSKLLSKLAY